MRVLLSLVLGAACASSSASAAEALRLDTTLLASVAAAGDPSSEALALRQVALGGLPTFELGHGAVAAQSPQGASGRSFGIGLQVGSPSAVTLKFGGPHQDGIVLGLGAGFGYGNAFGASLWLHADYLFHFATLLDGDGANVSVYAGPGLFATIFGSNYGFGYRGDPYYRNFDTVGFGIRVPVGLSVAFDALPLELYVQLDPAISVFPGIGFGIGGSLGFRYYL